MDKMLKYWISTMVIEEDVYAMKALILRGLISSRKIILGALFSILFLLPIYLLIFFSYVGFHYK